MRVQGEGERARTEELRGRDRDLRAGRVLAVRVGVAADQPERAEDRQRQLASRRSTSYSVRWSSRTLSAVDGDEATGRERRQGTSPWPPSMVRPRSTTANWPSAREPATRPRERDVPADPVVAGSVVEARPARARTARRRGARASVTTSVGAVVDARADPSGVEARGQSYRRTIVQARRGAGPSRPPVPPRPPGASTSGRPPAGRSCSCRRNRRRRRSGRRPRSVDPPPDSWNVPSAATSTETSPLVSDPLGDDDRMLDRLDALSRGRAATTTSDQPSARRRDPREQLVAGRPPGRRDPTRSSGRLGHGRLEPAEQLLDVELGRVGHVVDRDA